MSRLSAKGKTVISTFSQTPIEMHCFSKMLLLWNGTTAFLGQPDDCIEFLQPHENLFKFNYNPIDYFLATSSLEEKNNNKMMVSLIKDYNDSIYFAELSRVIDVHHHSLMDTTSIESLKPNIKIAWSSQFFSLIKRSNMYFLSPKMIVKRLLLSILMVLIVAIMFSGQDWGSDLILNQSSLVLYLNLFFVLIMLTMISSFNLSDTFSSFIPIVHSELRNSLYRIDAYYLSNQIILVLKTKK